jgi:flagellar FliL protein
MFFPPEPSIKVPISQIKVGTSFDIEHWGKNMAENKEKTTETPDGAAKKKGKLKLLIMIGAPLLLGIGGAGFFLMTGSSDDKSEKIPSAGSSDGDVSQVAPIDGQETSAPAPQTQKADNKEEIKFGATYSLKPFHINLGNPLENNYIRLEAAIEYKGGDPQKAEIEARLPQLRDAVISVTSRKTREFLIGPDGKDQLRRELLNRLNQYMDRKIEAVYITDMLIE